MITRPTWEDIQIGDIVVAAEHTPDERQLFLFSAASHNAHRIHYDLPYANSEGYKGLLVHGPLQQALMARFLTGWAGPTSRLVRLTLRHQGSATVGERLRFHAEVTDKRLENEAALIDLSVCEFNAAGNALMPGKATIQLPRFPRSAEP